MGWQYSADWRNKNTLKPATGDGKYGTTNGFVKENRGENGDGWDHAGLIFPIILTSSWYS